MWKNGTRWILDLLWPSACAACDSPSEGGLFCEPCLGTLVPGWEVNCPHCGRLSLGNESSLPEHLCGACLRDPPPWTRARGAFGYGGVLRDVISRWKNVPDHRLGPSLGGLISDAAEPMGWTSLCPETLVVPVPAHPSTLRRRGFHPPGSLAYALGRRTGFEVRVDCLSVRRPLSSTRGASRAERRRRLRGAFRCTTHQLRDRSVLLVDDVITTGATVRAAAEVCRRAGAHQVEVAALARTPDNGIGALTMVGSAAPRCPGGSS